ncbi:MAG: long-chain fatty acid--CoA ligase [Burkholderiaceae bacterium]
MSRALSQALEAACRSFGDAVALSGATGALRYTQLAERARGVARLLADAGLEANEPVHVRVSNQALDLAALLGVWLAGGVAVAMHRATPASLAASLQQRSRARFAVDLQGTGAAPLSTISTDLPPKRALLDDAALIIFTSGSTGVPKGVVLGHDAFYAKIQQIDALLGFRTDDRVLLVLNITFGFGLWLSLLTLLRGGTLVMSPKFEPEAFLRALLTERITRVAMVPTMMRVVFSDEGHATAIDHVAQRGVLRQILIGGESLGVSLAQTIRRRFTGTQLIDIYGLSETSTCDFFAFPADSAKTPGSIGRPSPNVSYRIADALGNPVDAGAVGELQIRSPYLMRGYLDDPELSAASYSDAWFKTGDLARERETGAVELMGRQKEVINRGGNKLSPVEIEQAICSHADVAAAMAVGIADALLGERLHVLVVPRAGVSPSIGALRQHLASRLEPFKQPDAFYVADALPLGRTGKADRGQFKGMVTSGELHPITP